MASIGLIGGSKQTALCTHLDIIYVINLHILTQKCTILWSNTLFKHKNFQSKALFQEFDLSFFVCIHTCICMFTNIGIWYVHIYIYIYTYMCNYCMYLHVSVCKCICANIHIYIYIYYKYNNMYIYIMSESVRVCLDLCIYIYTHIYIVYVFV